MHRGGQRTFDDDEAAQEDEHDEQQPCDGVGDHKAATNRAHSSEQANRRRVHHEQDAHEGEKPALASLSLHWGWPAVTLRAAPSD